MKSLLSAEVIFSFPSFRVTNRSPIVSDQGTEEEIHSKPKRSLIENQKKGGQEFFMEKGIGCKKKKSTQFSSGKFFPETF